MKKRMIPLILAFSVLFSACSKDAIRGEGPVITETRALSGFDRITVNGSTKVYISPGTGFSVEVNGYGNLLPYFETRVINNGLELGYTPGTNIKNDNTEVYISLPVLAGLETNGSADFICTGNFPPVSDFNAKVTGSGHIYFSRGSCIQFRSVLEGSGSINMLNMSSSKAETNITGSGTTEISVSQELNVRISGSGKVYYRGNPVISSSISGSGEILPK